MEACLRHIESQILGYEYMLASIEPLDREWLIYEWLRNERGIAQSMLRLLAEIRDIDQTYRREFTLDIQYCVIRWEHLRGRTQALRTRFVHLTGGPLV